MVRLICELNSWVYELLSIVADFLIQSGLATHIRFHGKRFAWFVSDGKVLSQCCTHCLNQYPFSHQKGLGVAAQYYGIWPIVSQGFRHREGVAEATGSKVEGTAVERYR
jgi:hypothetical protein